MDLHIANSDDITSVLDRILDKGIVCDLFVRITPKGVEPIMAGPSATLVSSEIFIGYGMTGTWKKLADLKSLFAFWRRDLWTK